MLTALCHCPVPIPRNSGFSSRPWSGINRRMGTKSRERLYGTEIRMAAERAALARQEADCLACEAWNKRMLGYKGPAQPSPTLGDALNAGYGYLEVRCLGCDTNQTVALDVVRRPRQRQSTSSSATCAARIARNCAAIRISGACSSVSAGPRSRHLIYPRSGGRANVKRQTNERSRLRLRELRFPFNEESLRVTKGNNSP